MTGTLRSAVGGPADTNNDIMSGGRKHRMRLSRSKKTRRAKTHRRRRGKKGGMGLGLGAVVQEAIVPFGIFALQKRRQGGRSHHAKSSHRKSYRRR